jgi:hypothetical protein
MSLVLIEDYSRWNKVGDYSRQDNIGGKKEFSDTKMLKYVIDEKEGDL